MPGESRERGKVGVEGRQGREPAVGEVQRCQRGEEREAFEGRRLEEVKSFVQFRGC